MVRNFDVILNTKIVRHAATSKRRTINVEYINVRILYAQIMTWNCSRVYFDEIFNFLVIISYYKNN